MKTKDKKKRLFAKNGWKRILKTIIIGLPLMVLVAYFISFRQRILPNVFLCQYNLSNQTTAEAKKELSKLIKQNPLSNLRLTYQGENWEIDLQNLGYDLNLTEAVNQAYRIGREKNLLKNLQNRISLWQKKEKLSFPYLINQNKLEEQIATVSAKLYVPAVNPQIKVVKNFSGQKRIEIEPGKNGQEVDLRLLLQNISKNLACSDPTPFEIPMISIKPQLTEEEQEKAKEMAQNLLEKKLEIVFEDESWFLTDEDLISFISFRSDLAEEKVDEYLENLKSSIERDPENAAFNMESDKMVVFRPAREGILLNRKKTKESLLEAIRLLEKEANLKDKKIEVSVSRIPPRIKNEDVNNLGIKEIIGTGKSRFKGSITERVHNIVLAAAKINGLVVAPGETFSFNRALGDVSEQTGFKKAYIIKEGRTILGDGGGVCQVSTTLFRALLSAGLPIEERHPHAYRVSYYEQDSQPGLDATVFDPGADLKFKNDTPAYILIQSQADTKNKALVFKLYGTTDNRQVTLGKVEVWDVIPPPPDQYLDDPTLPAGVIKQIDWKAAGAKVRFTWKVTRGNEVLQNRTFFSPYQPWQAIFLRGVSR